MRIIIELTKVTAEREITVYNYVSVMSLLVAPLNVFILKSSKVFE